MNKSVSEHEEWPDINVLTFKTPEDAQKAKKLFEEMQATSRLLAQALADWQYQYPDRHLQTEYAEALKLLVVTDRN